MLKAWTVGEPSLVRILFRFSHMVNSFLRPIKIIERHIWFFSVSYVFLIVKLVSEKAFLKLYVHFCFQKKPGGETEQQELTYPSLQVDDLGVWSDWSYVDKIIWLIHTLFIFLHHSIQWSFVAHVLWSICYGYAIKGSYLNYISILEYD